MKTTSWLSLDHHEYICIDLIDGRRIELGKNERLDISVDTVSIVRGDGVTILYPSIQVVQIIKKYKKRYIS